MRAFVTGSTGLLGNNLVRALLARGYEVVGLARSAAKARRLLADTRAHIVIGDMLSVDSFAAALESCQVIFHTAAYFREAFAPGADLGALDDVNVHATIALLEAAELAGADCFVHVGSGGVVGRKSDGCAGDEQTPPSAAQRANPYLRSKLRADAAIEQHRRRGALRVVKILPGWIWGPYDDAPTAAGKLLAEFAASRIPAVIDGGTTIVDARDVAEAMILAAERAPDRERYIVGGRYVSMAELLAALQRVTAVRAPRLTIPHPVLFAYAAGAEAWARLVGGQALITRQAVRLMHAKIAIDSRKAEYELGVSFRPLEQTLGDAWTWMLDNRPCDFAARPR
ncbi:MAG: NAD-dependent epimerase/dehydratase family protein [Deltaproteobacteria bacterium]|nr:NAD-dependent epimerase/dehydratase family protein [Deltaproteobacteria bacterium]